MGWAHRDREAHGKALKKAAKQCGVPRETWLLLKPNSARAAYAAVAQLCAATPAGTPGKEPAAAAWLALQRAFLAPEARAKARGPPTGRAKRRAKAKPEGGRPRRKKRPRVGLEPDEDPAPEAPGGADGEEDDDAQGEEPAAGDFEEEAPPGEDGPPAPDDEEALAGNEGEGDAVDEGDAPAGGAGEEDNEGGGGGAGAGDDAPVDTEEADAEGTEAADGSGGRRGFRVRGTSLLCTYNHRFTARPFPDGTPRCGSHGALWGEWRQWLQERIHALGITKYTATMEESLNARDRQRVHFHLKANFKDREWPSCQFGMIRDDVFFLANA